MAERRKAVTDRRNLASVFIGVHRDASGSGPKYEDVKRAILTAIEEGMFPPGSKLPPEVQLAAELPVSLGTIQHALRDLADEGIVTRRQGHGTFVARSASAMEEPWHCRFIGADGRRYMPIFTTVLARGEAQPGGAWSEHLRSSESGVVRIDRRISVDREFVVFSRFFIAAAHGQGLMTASTDELENVNFKQLLARDLGLPVTHVRQTVRADRLPAEACDVIGVPTGTVGLLVNGSASAGLTNPVYFQELFIPPTERELYLSSGDPFAGRTSDATGA